MRFNIYLASGEYRTIERAYLLIGVGSAPSCDVRIADDPAVEPHHVDIEPGVERVTLHRATGPVLVDGRPLPADSRVRYGQILQIGATRIELQSTFERHMPSDWDPRQYIWVRARQLSDDPVEHELLATLRRHPADDATRGVYADYLLDRGRDASAEAVRGRPVDRDALLAESTVDWRAIALREPIIACERHDCPRTWSGLRAITDDRLRTCEVCTQNVHYCATVAHVCTAVARGEPYVADPALVETTAYTDRVHAALERAIAPGWRLAHHAPYANSPYEARWDVITQEEGVLSQVYQLLLDGATLHLHYGGNDAGPIQLHGPTRHNTSGLRLAGLDDDALVAWLRHNFATLPTSTWGFS